MWRNFGHTGSGFHSLRKLVLGVKQKHVDGVNIKIASNALYRHKHIKRRHYLYIITTMPNFLHEVGVNAASPLLRVREVSAAPQPALIILFTLV